MIFEVKQSKAIPNILLLSSPRSGSTWFGQTLCANGQLNYIHEPDNERHNFRGFYGKQDLPRIPLDFSQKAKERYIELFQYAFYQGYMTFDSISNQILKKWIDLRPERVEEILSEQGKNKIQNLTVPYIFSFLLPKQIGNRSHRLVKTVHAMLATDLLKEALPEVKFVGLVRHPAASIASMIRLKNSDIDRKLYLNPMLIEKYPQLVQVSEDWTVERKAGVQQAIFHRELVEKSEKHDFQIHAFEPFSLQPFESYYELYNQLGLNWNEKVEEFLIRSNTAGSGYDSQRISNKQADKWKKELSSDQIREIQLGYSLLSPTSYPDFIL